MDASDGPANAQAPMTLDDREAGRLLRLVVLAQAAYFLVTGLWGVVHRVSFERVAGPKTDYWLVRSVGSLVAVIGVVLAAGARRSGRPAGTTVLLAAGSATALGAVEGYTAAKGRISVVYLADAAVEAAFVTAEVVLWRRARGGPDGGEVTRW